MIPESRKDERGNSTTKGIFFGTAGTAVHGTAGSGLC